ncbi:hypothetical protein GCM10009613_60700 [Pseudonocardia kongjuensis]|uniref:Uncharacterized protein n=1 Tax=Pseudonocardia kongjuensis TaxID=102227 RepID=A0ABP4IY41_9PSEU
MLVPVVGWLLARLHSVRMTAYLVLDEARCRVEQESLDQHFATVPRDRPAGAGLAPLHDGRPVLLSRGYELDPSWVRLDGDAFDDVVRHVVALGKPHAPVLQVGAGHPTGKPLLDDLAEDVDERRVDAAMRYLSGEFVEIVRKSS